MVAAFFTTDIEMLAVCAAIAPGSSFPTVRGFAVHSFMVVVPRLARVHHSSESP